MVEALIEWRQTESRTYHYQTLVCGKCHKKIESGRLAIIRLKDSQEYAQILCERCGETLEKEAGR